ncbi:sigma intracellular receptor 2-like [Pistacia vera]|uniref:sigma intracellular receptor 2-like n=1 Tax=Pistacia vera TaxID=55513 RepID=UPI001263B267|nr:sigma intracellular receptor 2-like [Pistacia vera]XP_031278698.1 sigma intracellular receptor 2-like [Pistacia vera]
MGALLNLVDAILFIFFLLIAAAAPLIDAQTCLPLTFFPQILIDIKQWYIRQYGDYLVSEKPHFFVGIVTHELVFQWPLAILNIFAILTSKSWFNTTCLMYGASVVTSMAAVLADLFGSGKASDELIMVYFPFMGLGVLAILRGLLGNPAKTTTLNIGKRSALGRKKKA